LRKQFPQVHLAVLTSPIGREALLHNPCIDQLLILEEPLLPRFLSLSRKLASGRFDAALLFHASQRLVLPALVLAGIPRIIGTRGQQKGLDELLTDCIEPQQYEHEIERRLKMAERLGAKRETVTLSYFVQPEERQAVKAFISSFSRPFVAIHPGSKEPFRRYPARHFVTVAKALEKESSCTIFLTGTPLEEALLLDIERQLPSAKIVPLRSSLRFLGAFLEQMDFVLSNDTGPFHLACALGRPSLGLYVSTDPRICGPYRAPSALALSKPPTCTPCLKRGCQAPFCFLQITPQEILEAMHQLTLLGTQNKCLLR
jgi:ADP-heptose:LPS heptosyltransferase